MTIDEILNNKQYVVLRYIAGSHLYGLNTPESDVDTRGIYLDEITSILTGKTADVVADEKNDNSFNELSKFVFLLHKSDPIVLESLYVPDDKILSTSYIYKLFRNNRTKFLSKKAIYSFCGYATEQIKRARGLNKKVSQEKKFAELGQEIVKPNILNFCYVANTKGGSLKVLDYLDKHNWEYSKCGLVNINNMKDTYAVFVEGEGHTDEYYNTYQSDYTYYYNGICRDPDNAYDVCLSSIPKGIESQFIMYFNKDAYSNYCRFYKEYMEWKEHRNPVRYNLNLKNEYDVKNMMHLMRLLEQGRLLLLNNDLTIVLPDDYRKFLLDIRAGKFEYDYLLNIAIEKKNEIDELLKTTTLPDEPDHKLIDCLYKDARLIQLNDFINY